MRAPRAAPRHATEIEHEGGTEYTDEGATAADTCDGKIAVKAVDGHVDAVKGNIRNLGDYKITYTAIDRAGMKTTATRSVKVVDTTKPVITRKGGAIVVIEASPDGTYSDAGATAHDRVDGTITDLIKTTNDVDCSQPKLYTVRYNVIDAVGIRAHEVTRAVRVEDTTAPELFMLGDKSMVVEGTEPYVEPGFSANDTLIGNLTGRVTIEYIHRRIVQPHSSNQSNASLVAQGQQGPGKYGPNTPNGVASNPNETASYYSEYVNSIDTYSPDGSVYYVDYTVEDDAGNSVVVRRTVTIRDTRTPTIFLSEPVENMVVEAVTEPYTEPGYVDIPSRADALCLCPRRHQTSTFAAQTRAHSQSVGCNRCAACLDKLTCSRSALFAHVCRTLPVLTFAVHYLCSRAIVV